MSKLTPFGIVIRKLRLEKGLKLLDMAEALEMSVAYLSAVETGRKPIPDGLVGKISRSLKWPADELAQLNRAIDKSRKEVRVEQHAPEERELIAAFARQLDDVPKVTIEQLRKIFNLKSIDGEAPFERKRRGIVVPPLGKKVIWDYADMVRDKFLPPETVALPIIKILEFGMPRVSPEFVFDVQDADEMGDDEGRVPVGGNELILRSDVYERACREGSRDRFTASHELGHYLMHRRITLARARGDEDKIYTDSEWQADTFAGSLLMPRRHASKFRNSDEMAEACIVSPRAAAVMWEKYREEGLVQ